MGLSRSNNECFRARFAHLRLLSKEHLSLTETTSRRRGGLLSTIIGTITGNLFLAVGTITCGSLAALSGLFRRDGKTVYRIARFWSRGLLWWSGVRVETEFATPIADSDCVVYMANHQSMFDIPVLIATLPGQTRFLAKKSLFQIPFFGWALHAGGFIPIDREDRSRARESFAAAVERLKEGSSVAIFPEETRASDRQLLPFQRGGFLLAYKSGLPIVPVGIDGTFEIQKKKSILIRPGVVRVRYGAPIDLKEYRLSKKKELLGDVRSQVGELANMSL